VSLSKSRSIVCRASLTTNIHHARDTETSFPHDDRYLLFVRDQLCLLLGELESWVEEDRRRHRISSSALGLCLGHEHGTLDSNLRSYSHSVELELLLIRACRSAMVSEAGGIPASPTPCVLRASHIRVSSCLVPACRISSGVNRVAIVRSTGSPRRRKTLEAGAAIYRWIGYTEL